MDSLYIVFDNKYLGSPSIPKHFSPIHFLRKTIRKKRVVEQHTLKHTLAVQNVVTNKNKMVVTAGQPCIVTLKNGVVFHATFIDVYRGTEFLTQSQTAHDFEEHPQTHAAYMAKLHSWTRLLRMDGPNRVAVIIPTTNIVGMDSLQDILSQHAALQSLPMEMLDYVIEFIQSS